MRIGLLAPPWAPVPPQLYGGIELVVDHLARGFQEARHDVVLFTTGDSTCDVPRMWDLDHSQGGRIGAGVPELRHVLAGYDALRGCCDIVHDHTVLGPMVAPEIAPGLPVITTIHGELDDDLGPICERVAQRVPLIAISHAQRRPLPHLPIMRVIHHGIDADAFPMGDGTGDADGEYTVFLGRMDPTKGAHRAAEAARKAGIRLLMAAKMREPAERAYFHEMVEPLLGNGIEYLGEVPHERKLEMLVGARALLFPIRWNEPFGLVMIEAMACGTPVLAFPEGAAPEVVQDGVTGFLCRDEAAMAEAIVRVDDLTRGACRAAVEGYFSTERMVQEHLAAFEELLD